jgi:hypothetical protein
VFIFWRTEKEQHGEQQSANTKKNKKNLAWQNSPAAITGTKLDGAKDGKRDHSS